jgi:mercuric ion transport protein
MYPHAMTVKKSPTADRRGTGLVAGGAIGAVLAAICCATPLLAVAFGAIGLGAWLAAADYVLIPVVLVCLVMVGLGLYRRRRRLSS